MIDRSINTAGAASHGRTRPRARWLAVAAIAASTLLTTAPIGPAAATDPVPSEVDALDVLQLDCEGRERDGAAVVACRWTVPDGAVGVRMIRLAAGSGESREVVHRTSDPWSNTFIDTDIRRGVRYLYVVQAVGAAGQVVAMSRSAVAGVAQLRDPTVEVLGLDCSATGDVTVRCAWSTPTVSARTLTLWRSVDGAIRERVASFAQPFPTSYGDVVPGSTSQSVYAVIVTDGAGDIVARSRSQVVELAGPTPTVRVEPEPVVPAADPAPASTIPVTTVPVATVPVTTVSPTTVVATVGDASPTATASQRPVVAAIDGLGEVGPASNAMIEVRVESEPEPVRTAVAERERAG